MRAEGPQPPLAAPATRRLHSPTVNERTQSRLRLVGRYWIASWMIPVGVAVGVGGLVQNWSRKARGWQRRTAPEPVGVPEGSGLRKVGGDS